MIGILGLGYVISELAKRYGALSVLGVEVVAVPPRSSPAAIAELGQTPPVLFPVVTDGNEAITAAFRMYAPGQRSKQLTPSDFQQSPSPLHQ